MHTITPAHSKFSRARRVGGTPFFCGRPNCNLARPARHRCEIGGSIVLALRGLIPATAPSPGRARRRTSCGSCVSCARSAGRGKGSGPPWSPCPDLASEGQLETSTPSLVSTFTCSGHDLPPCLESHDDAVMCSYRHRPSCMHRTHLSYCYCNARQCMMHVLYRAISAISDIVLDSPLK